MTCTDFLAKLTDFFDGVVPPELEQRLHTTIMARCCPPKHAAK